MLFDENQEFFHAPAGAHAQGGTLRLRLTPPRTLGVAAAFVCFRPDGQPQQQTLEMCWRALSGGCDVYECAVPFADVGLYWYYFRLETADGTRYVLPDGRGARLSAQPGAAFQQTVFSSDFTTPAWLRGGVIYQIFPDRFCRAGAGKQPDRGRRLHARWDEQPDFSAVPEETRNDDFFGGNLRGIEEKLPYLHSLGVTCLYLNPIFEAFSNHRYDTGDYSRIDPLLGEEADFVSLCRAAHALGIRVLLDGVFSHTGSDSVYFNRYGTYPGPGAYQSQQSPYFSWYEFQHFPDRYTCWWGVPSLPCVRETNEDFLRYITGPDGIVRKYLRLGADGWRLDVADELPDGFLDALRAAAKEENPDAVILGEVWEDASNKISYGARRRYLLGRQLDSVMNYPVGNAILRFCREGDGRTLADTVLSLQAHYPDCVTHILMNLLDTHDTPRALTALVGEDAAGRGRDWQSAQRLSPEQYAAGVRLLRLASLLQYTLPGVPSLYYGDEAGLQGYGDPFNRGTYPWGREDATLLEWYRALGRLRAASPCLRDGRFLLLEEADGLLVYRRESAAGCLTVAANGSGEPRGWQGRTLPAKGFLLLGPDGAPLPL